MYALLLVDGSIHQGSISAPVRKLMVHILFVGLIHHKEGYKKGAMRPVLKVLRQKFEAALRFCALHDGDLQ